uniref:Suppressor of cytokine signaling 2 n=1 Tax=Knipowitschia caucasica TaxID=637954 RepID=A0AAV2ISR7_KNICA
MTCQSFEASERRADANTRAVESDESHIALAMKELKNTGWYWGSLTANGAKEILQDATEGTFLLRDSSQRDYLFTISAVTSAASTNGTVQLILTKPLYTSTPSLQHLSRIAINRRTQQIQALPLPNRLKDYLLDYTYNV